MAKRDLQAVAVVLAALVVIVAMGLAYASAVVDWKQSRKIERLERHVACLEHPWQASSVYATSVNGHLVTKPPARSDCLHPKGR